MKMGSIILALFVAFAVAVVPADEKRFVSVFVPLEQKNMNELEFNHLPLYTRIAYLESPFARVNGDVTRDQLLKELKAEAEQYLGSIGEIQMIRTRGM